MTRYLLDTNVVSELRKPKPHGAVVAWMKTLQAEQIFLSAVTIGELQAGVELTRRQDAVKAAYAGLEGSIETGTAVRPLTEEDRLALQKVRNITTEEERKLLRQGEGQNERKTA